MRLLSPLNLALAAWAMAAVPARADVTYSSGPAIGEIGIIGATNVESRGEVFQAPGGNLLSWTFSAKAFAEGNVALVVAAWDGSRAVGPALFISAPIAVDADFREFPVGGMNLALTLGATYIAFVTAAGVADPADDVLLGRAADGETGVIGLGNARKFSDGADPLTLDTPWSFVTTFMDFTAVFSEPAAVPEPASLALLGAGLLGLAGRCRVGGARPIRH